VSLGGVLENVDPGLTGQLDDGGHRSHLAVEMHRHDRLCPLRDQRFYRRGVNGVVVSVDIGEHRRCPDHPHRVRARGERERGDNHLVPGPDAHGEQPDVQRGGAAAHCNCVPDAGHIGESRLEVRDPGP
jgi:hypothetical protein